MDYGPGWTGRVVAVRLLAAAAELRRRPDRPRRLRIGRRRAERPGGARVRDLVPGPVRRAATRRHPTTRIAPSSSTARSRSSTTATGATPTTSRSTATTSSSSRRPTSATAPVTGAGSWQYGLTKECSDDQKAGALEYLKFSMDDKYIAAFSDATSLIPATTSAAAADDQGLLRCLVSRSRWSLRSRQDYALVRPRDARPTR